jgi:opacity protein-like surface antigen
MKKLLILVSAVALSGTMFAQKAGSDNPFSLEGAMNVSKEGVSWAAPNLRMRYFIQDNLALRLTLGRDAVSSTSTETSTVYDSTGNATTTTSEVTTKNSIMNLGLAAEYHLAGTDRMSPYFTAGFNVGNDTRTEISTFGLNLGAGIDYYVAENIYLGLELGFNYNSSEGNSNSGFAGGSAVRMGWRF